MSRPKREQIEALTVEQLRSMWGSAIPDSY